MLIMGFKLPSLKYDNDKPVVNLHNSLLTICICLAGLLRRHADPWGRRWLHLDCPTPDHRACPTCWFHPAGACAATGASGAATSCSFFYVRLRAVKLLKKSFLLCTCSWQAQTVQQVQHVYPAQVQYVEENSGIYTNGNMWVNLSVCSDLTPLDKHWCQQVTAGCSLFTLSSMSLTHDAAFVCVSFLNQCTVEFFGLFVFLFCFFRSCSQSPPDDQILGVRSVWVFSK